jgi:pyruvate dehydrogenase E2 component (dihydrolipoamide acetyltransferase)
MSMNRTRRKLAMVTWSAPSEGNIYGKLEVDAEALMAHLERVSAETGTKVTVTHAVGKAVADALAAAPGLNGRIFLGRYIPHDTVDVTYLVALEDGGDLGKAKIDQADTKSLTTIATELRTLAGRLRSGGDEDFEKTKGTLRLLPTWILRPLVHLTGWLASAWGLSVPALGVRPFPFGSCIITSVGMFGLDEAFAPPTPFARVPVLVLVGAVREVPVVHEGAVAIRRRLTITATIDHRFVDGAPAARLAKVVKQRLENPETLG